MEAAHIGGARIYYAYRYKSSTMQPCKTTLILPAFDKASVNIYAKFFLQRLFGQMHLEV